MIDRSIIARVMEAAQVEEVVGDFVNLKKRGAHYVSLCPFHNEKTPSFVVSPNKGIYKCFGCGKAGTAATFLQEHEGMSYVEALQYLGSKYGIDIAEQTADDKAQYETEESLYVINAFAQRYYQDNLFNTEQGKSVGLAYFKERGYREDIIRKFQLGYALDASDNLTKEALSKGHRLELLKELGLVSERDNRRFDFFRDRVIFSIHNLSGKVAAFAGRTLSKEGPKYVNSPESSVYHKSRILYGAFQSRNAIRQSDECILVEGYTDVISLHQNGIENVVASSGTSLTEDQIRLIKRFSSNVLIIYDGDAAGVKASLRGVDLLLQGGLNVRVVALPEGEDPDSYVKLVGATEFRAYVNEKATDFLLFKVKQMLQSAPAGPSGKAEVIKAAVESIARIPDPIKRSLYLKECSTMMRVEERILITEMNRVLRSDLYRQGQINKTESEDLERLTRSKEGAQQAMFTNTGEAQERDVVRVLLEYGDKEIEPGKTVAQYVVDALGEVEMVHPVLNRIMRACCETVRGGGMPASSDFIQHTDSEVSVIAIDLVTEKYHVSKNWERYDIVILEKAVNYQRDVASAVKRYQLWHTMRLIQENSRRQTEASDVKVQDELVRIKMFLDGEKSRLANELSTVITR